jgi:hypothetical protein
LSFFQSLKSISGLDALSPLPGGGGQLDSAVAPVSTPSGHDHLISALPSDVLTINDVLWPAATPSPPENLALVVLDEEASQQRPLRR